MNHAVIKAGNTYHCLICELTCIGWSVVLKHMTKTGHTEYKRTIVYTIIPRKP